MMRSRFCKFSMSRFVEVMLSIFAHISSNHEFSGPTASLAVVTKDMAPLPLSSATSVATAMAPLPLAI